MKPLQPLDLRLCDKPPVPPEFVLDGILERGCVTMLSGDTGSAKSMIALSMSVAVIRGEPWQGRATKPGPVIYSDAEMHHRVVYERLHGFGVHGRDRALTYLSRAGIDLGSPASVKALRAFCTRHKASVLVLDALMGHTPPGDVNDNSAAVLTYTETLRPLAADLELALVLVHHESKGRAGRRNSSLAAMGARQLVAQADYQLTLERAPGPFTTSTTEPDGSRLETYRVRLRLPKRRDAGDTGRFEPLRVVSRHTPEGALVKLSIEPDDTAGGVSSADGQDNRQELAERIGAFVKDKDGETTTAEIAAALKMNSTAGTFKRAVNQALSLKLVRRVSKGVYR